MADQNDDARAVDAAAAENGETTVIQRDEDQPSDLRRIMSQYFMEYASYVIKDRAIPLINDGLKPVQRRILHSLDEMDDGKFHKVANVVGNTMKYHPHGDSSIYSALVHIANKGFFIDRQGNFGNIFTGDPASAARYIECRLSPLAREVLFNKETTEFVDSYDGRNVEPVAIPSKVPVLLLQGAEGIAVGMSTRIMPHNFREVLEAQIAILQKREFAIYPDFLQGGLLDVSEYEDGRGRLRLRAKIDIVNPKTLVIREIPATTTTENLMASIEDAAQKNKIKIAGINDYTAESVEIEIGLPRNVYADQTIKALYAYTDCEVAISVNCLVIQDNRPVELTVSDVLRHNTQSLVDLLERELQLELAKLQDQFHRKTLVQIFIENRIYKRIEKCETWDRVIAEVHKGLVPFRDQLMRDVTDEDVQQLLQIPIRRISLFDLKQNQDDIAKIVQDIKRVERELKRIVKYTIGYLEDLLKKYAEQYPRHTQLEAIEQVDVRQIALSNIKVGIDRSQGYIGTAVKSDTFLNCTEFDRIVFIRSDGTYKVIPIPEKLYIGSVVEVAIADKEQVYSIVYREKKSKLLFAKRFRIDSYIMDREYVCVPKGCRVDKLYTRYGVKLRCELEPAPRQRIDHVALDFNDIPIRGAKAKGLKFAGNKRIAKILQLERGSEKSNAGAEEDSAPAEPPPASSTPSTRYRVDEAGDFQLQ